MARSITGRKFPVELRARMGEFAGRPCRLVCVRDITNRKKTERKLIQSQKMEAVGTLASGIAHDFNNMLAGIQGNVEILRRKFSDDDPRRKRMDIICQIVERGAKLTGQLLGYARGGQVEVREIDLNQLIEGTLEMFGRTQRHIIIETCLDHDTPKVEGDPTQIEQVLLNLMINAVHAMPDGGQLFIETAAARLSNHESRVYEIVPGRYAMLSVRDTGKGMDRETQKKIFEPFFTTKKRGEGTGLGLASTYGIVKAHKGYIEVYSEPGEGSQFNVLLPVAEQTKALESADNTVVEKGTETLMIVDDEPDFLDVGREMLEILGYTVIAASGSDEAIQLFSSDPGAVRLVILDMIMPGPPIGEIIRRLREIDGSVPVLLASGYSQDAEAVRRSLKMCNGFIQKPFRMVALSRKIREIFQDAQDENH
jgi:nitrogen-specific signal transduction histidine kinase/CheY-like chemotaxis protein